MHFKLSFFLFLFSLFYSLQAQENFPEDYFGIYKGTLLVSAPQGTKEYAMEFHLQATDSLGKYQYTLVYGDGDQRQERPYFLIAKDASKGKYIIDEDNGIILDAQQFDNHLYSLFEVNNNLLNTFITFKADHMVFEITVASKEQQQTTYATEDQTEVISYPITTRQKAILMKE